MKLVVTRRVIKMAKLCSFLLPFTSAIVDVAKVGIFFRVFSTRFATKTKDRAAVKQQSAFCNGNHTKRAAAHWTVFLFGIVWQDLGQGLQAACFIAADIDNEPEAFLDTATTRDYSANVSHTVKNKQEALDFGTIYLPKFRRYIKWANEIWLTRAPHEMW